MSFNIHIIIAIIIFFLAETIGLWFVNTQLTIPSERMNAAVWVYHFSVLTFIVNVISVPYNAAIIAREKMGIFAWISIIEVSLKLLAAFSMLWVTYDSLKLYAVLLFVVAVIIRLIYGIYCSRTLKEAKLKLYWNKDLFITLFSFAGWNLWGNLSSTLYGQGVNIILNIFFGPAINAARGIAFQLKSAVRSFVQNFQMAMNPQIIKSYASENLTYMHNLIIQGSKISYCLMLVLSVPIIFETELILSLWLVEVPNLTVIFTRLIIINVLIDSISGPLMTAAQASGKIKVYQSVVGGLMLTNLPLSYLFLKNGHPPEVTLYISIILSIIALVSRLKIITPLINLPIKRYIIEVIVKVTLISIISLSSIFFISEMISLNSIYRLILISLISIISVGVNMYIFGFNNNERSYINKIIKEKIYTHIVNV